VQVVQNFDVVLTTYNMLLAAEESFGGNIRWHRVGKVVATERP